MTGNKYESTPFLMSERAWERLTSTDQKIFMDAAAEATQLQRRLNKEADDKLVAELKGKGVQIDTVNSKAFAEACKPVYDKWTSGATGDFVKKVVAAAH